MTAARRDWMIAIAYVGSIYATLEVVPIPLAYLRAHNLLRFTIGLVFAACLVYLFIVMHSRTRNVWRYLSLVALAAVYAWAVALVRRPEEKTHFIQYGLVGALFVRAIRHHVTRPMVAFAAAMTIATAAGWLDETIQGWLPNRHYDLSDITLDAASAFLGLVAYAVMPHQKSAKLPPR